MEMFIVYVPAILGVVLVLVGVLKIFMRTKGTVHTEGIITDIAKTHKKYARVDMTMEAPVVRYTINGVQYSGVSAKFFIDGIMNFKKGNKIYIRVNKKNYRKFVPEESGDITEKLLVFFGVFLILATVVILCRYGV